MDSQVLVDVQVQKKYTVEEAHDRFLKALISLPK